MTLLKRLLAAALAALPLIAHAIDYPPTPKGNTVDDYFGTRVADPYRWLEDLDSPQTRAWIKAQDALTLPFLAALPERPRFAKHLTGFLNQERYGLPKHAGANYFFTWNPGLWNQAALFVQGVNASAPRLLLDPNTLSSDGTVALTEYRPSPDGKWLAYGTAAAGSDWNQFKIRNVATGEDAPETLKRIKFSGISWTHDNAGFFYSRYPDAQASATGLNQTVFDELSNQALYYHRVGTPQSADVAVYAAPEHPKWFVGGEVSDDGRYLLIDLRQDSADENQLLIKDLGKPDAPSLQTPVTTLASDFHAAWNVIGIHDGKLIALTNDQAPRRRIVAMPIVADGSAQATTLVAQSSDTIADATVAGGQIIVSTMHDAASRLLRYTLDGKAMGELALPGLGAVSGLSGHADSSELFIGFTSFNQPTVNLWSNLNQGTVSVFQPLKLGFDPADYVTEQVFYPSLDGTRIPLFITHRKDITPDGERRVFLHGYGGFDIPKTPYFDPAAMAWMAEGGVFAVACLRGGGEYGEEWHLAGTKARKQNVFDDFYAAGKYMVASGWTTPSRIAIWGRSNGGLLVGASVNQHPDFWGAAVATVGVMDMLRFHKFTVGYAWRGDYGSSETKEGFDYLIKYSPLHTVKPGTHYPPTLITTGDHDDRVHPAHSYKYAATLQAAQGGDAPILIRIDTNAGHGGGKPISKILAEEADKLAFMWHYTAAGAP